MLIFSKVLGISDYHHHPIGLDLFNPLSLEAYWMALFPRCGYSDYCPNHQHFRHQGVVRVGTQTKSSLGPEIEQDKCFRQRYPTPTMVRLARLLAGSDHAGEKIRAPSSRHHGHVEDIDFFHQPVCQCNVSCGGFLRVHSAGWSATAH